MKRWAVKTFVRDYICLKTIKVKHMHITLTQNYSGLLILRFLLVDAPAKWWCKRSNKQQHIHLTVSAVNINEEKLELIIVIFSHDVFISSKLKSLLEYIPKQLSHLMTEQK